MKKRISIFLVLVLVLSIGFANIPGKLANAEGTVSDTIAAKLNKIYSCMDPTDILNINNAKDKITLLASNDAVWDSILDSSILTDTVTTKLGGVDAAKTALIKFIQDLAGITYNGDLTALTTSLNNFKTSNLATYQSLFGTDVTIDDFYQLFINAEIAFPAVIAGNTAWRDTLAHGSYADLIAIVPEIVKEAIVQGMTPTLVGKLSSVGWSMDLLKTKLVALINFADTANKDAQISTAKAIVRAEAILTVDPVGSNANVDNTTIDGSTTTLITYALTLMGNDATDIVSWNSSNPSVAAFGGLGLGNSQLVPKANGSTIITVYRQGAVGVTTTPEEDWIVKSFTLNVTGFATASITGKVTQPAATAGTFSDLAGVTVSIKDTAYTTVTDSTGNYSFTNLPSSTGYILVFDKAKYAHYEIANVALNAGETKSVNKVMAQIGDVNGDSFINVGDASAVVMNYVKGTALNYPEAGDVNKDTFINVGDASAIIMNYVKGTQF